MEPEGKLGTEALVYSKVGNESPDLSRPRRTRGVSRQMVVYSKSPKKPRMTEETDTIQSRIKHENALLQEQISQMEQALDSTLLMFSLKED
jgi:hypothetical protein